MVESDKTPEATKESSQSLLARANYLVEKLIRAVWGEETFSPEETSPENNMSVVQYANLCNEKILLSDVTQPLGFGLSFLSWIKNC